MLVWIRKVILLVTTKTLSSRWRPSFESVQRQACYILSRCCMEMARVVGRRVMLLWTLPNPIVWPGKDTQIWTLIQVGGGRSAVVFNWALRAFSRKTDLASIQLMSTVFIVLRVDAQWVLCLLRRHSCRSCVGTPQIDPLADHHWGCMVYPPLAVGCAGGSWVMRFMLAVFLDTCAFVRVLERSHRS